MKVYVAIPMTLYEPDSVYRRLIRRVLHEFPGAEIVSPKEYFMSSGQWKYDWPALVPTLDALVLIPDGDRIGLGCLREVADALYHNIPVWVLKDSLTPIDDYDFCFLSDEYPSSAIQIKEKARGGSHV